MFIKSFDQLSKNDVQIAGGKGASLGEMTLQLCLGQANVECSVPPGFVILAGAFDKFMEEADLTQEIAACLAGVNYKDINSVDKASNVIRDLVHDTMVSKDLEDEILAEYDKLADLTHPSPLFKKEREKSTLAKRRAEKLYVAVRSSATAEDSAVASWAGELESYLNTTKETLLENIKKCWSSLFTPRALFYAFEKKLVRVGNQNKVRAKTCLPAVASAKEGLKMADCYPVSVAVVVQKMVQSEVSGICFTVHPVTKDKNQMIIEAGWGLGEAIVGGRITPDAYVVNKSQVTSSGSRSIIDKNISEQGIMIVRSTRGTSEVKVPKTKQGKQKLPDDKIIELAKICLNIEKHYGRPQDIEWAMEKEKFYIVQSRPITTL